MFNLFYALFKYKEKAQKDELGYYPEKVDVRAFPERRYLWTSRFLVVITCMSLCVSIILSATLIFLIPMKKTKMMPLMIDYDRYQITKMEKYQSIAFAGDLATESVLDYYIKQRYTIGDDAEELKFRFGENQFIYLTTDTELYEYFLKTEYPYFEKLQKEGRRRKVVTTLIYPVSFDFWQVRFNIIETGPNGDDPVTSYWIATIRMQFKFEKYENKNLGLINPLGLTVTSYNISYMGNNLKSKRD